MGVLHRWASSPMLVHTGEDKAHGCRSECNTSSVEPYRRHLSHYRKMRTRLQLVGCLLSAQPRGPASDVLQLQQQTRCSSIMERSTDHSCAGQRTWEFDEPAVKWNR